MTAKAAPGGLDLAACRLYAILDLGYVKPARLLEVAARLVKGGVDLVQLRAKNVAAPAILEMAKELRKLLANAGTPLVVNDHPAIAAEAGADGLHLGQDDMPLAEARQEFGGFIGKSTHSLEQARAADAEGADYIAFGPLFATPTKPDYPAVGLDRIGEVQATVQLPVFCIGGIKLENLPAVIAAGARRAVIVSGLLRADDPTDYAARCKALLSAAAHSNSKPRNS